MALAAALVCLLVVMVFSGAVVQSLVLQRRQSRWDERQLQCHFLLQSALERARNRIATEPAFAGETWTVSADGSGGLQTGIAQIRILPLPDHPELRRVEIEARWPDDPQYRVQRIQPFTIPVTPAGVEP